MSLLLTSCTMGKQPDRLLNKGPQYLRTRTNSGLFAQNKTSAVELLAASKAQYYTVKRSVDLDKQQDLAVTDGQSERYQQSIAKKGPVRSKSDYDISQLHLTITDEESDENNNDINDNSLNISKDATLKDSDLLNTQNKATVDSKEEERNIQSEDALNDNQNTDSFVDTSQKPGLTNQSELTILLSATQEQIQKSNLETTPLSLIDETDQSPIKKPIPLPRKLKEKPVPPARKPRIRSPFLETSKVSEQCLSPIEVSRTCCLPHNPSLSSPNPLQEESKLKASPIDDNCGVARSQSCSNSFPKHLLPLNAKPPLPRKPLLLPKEVKHSQCKIESESTPHTYTATAIFISKPNNVSQKLVSERISIADKHTQNCTPPAQSKLLEASVIKDEIGGITGKRKNPDVPVSGRVVEKEIKTIDFCTAGSGPDWVEPASVSEVKTVEKSNSISTSTLEMSIESVDQAVYESEISAIPTASVEATMMQEVDPEIREITRSNSSLSGKIEQQNTSPLSVSPTPHYSSVPRSYSDISCHLEGQHSRDSSIVSSHSRLSRASVGTDLENFFNQMGLEKGILEPISRLKELQTSEVFDSMSSLDSHDAASICSTYSCSEQEWSDSQSTDRSQQQTSIVERNARIIKWLCNVRKAKTQTQKSDSAAASNA